MNVMITKLYNWSPILKQKDNVFIYAVNQEVENLILHQIM
jgi:hypothetical protein